MAGHFFLTAFFLARLRAGFRALFFACLMLDFITDAAAFSNHVEVAFSKNMSRRLFLRVPAREIWIRPDGRFIQEGRLCIVAGLCSGQFVGNVAEVEVPEDAVEFRQIYVSDTGVNRGPTAYSRRSATTNWRRS